MNRYYFDIRDNEGLSIDEEGVEFATQSEAESEAAQSLADLAKEMAPLDQRKDVAIEVRVGARRVFQAALIFDRSATKQ
jgi:hypothetical protein